MLCNGSVFVVLLLFILDVVSLCLHKLATYFPKWCSVNLTLMSTLLNDFQLYSYLHHDLFYRGESHCCTAEKKSKH